MAAIKVILRYSMSFFEVDTKIEQLDDHRWRAELKSGWRVGTVPNGGYVLAIAGRVLSAALPHKDPLTVNAFYLAPTSLGEVICEVEILRKGKGTSFAQLRMFQEGELKLQVMAAYTTLENLQGPSWSSAQAPDYAAWEKCHSLQQPSHLEIAQRVEIRLTEGNSLFDSKRLNGDGVFGGWIQHRDGAAADPFALLMFADAMPPPVFTVYGFQSWVPTVELTVQVRGRPAPGPLKMRVRTRHLSDGVLEEDGEIWDINDQLVAVSRQTAKLRISHLREGAPS
ncbi:MAG: thioesterase family protein [Pseudomonadales bacterium]